ncbi:hypothetical protein [Nocardia sp. NPDC057440]|uniref:hypothetical protein n=1 Tax=Nocardia sp. NPDC057440 TaxID=3346134 RepID=UPI0036733EBF
MAFRKKKILEQVTQKLAEVGPPGEQFNTAFLAITGPSPWVDSLPYVRLVMVFLRKYYFVVLTNTSVVLIEASKWTGRPTNLVSAEHFQTAEFSGLEINSLWSKVFYRLPGTAVVERLNVHRQWRTELDELVRVTHQAPEVQQPSAHP